MGIIEKLGLGALVLALLGGGAYWVANTIQSQAERIGELESENGQLVASLEDSEKSAKAVRAQLEMWQWLYDDLQSGYSEIREDREQMSAELAQLRQEADVEDYLECPMPDSLYEWVRQN